MDTISHNLAQVRQQLRSLMDKYQRNPAEVILLAVSKTKSVAEIKQAVLDGQYRFGENYLQEALPKIEALKSYELQWHFIGQMQSNKTRDIAENFHWVHSLYQLKHAQRLSQQRPENLAPLQVTIQVNIDNEPQKAGLHPYAALDFAKKIQALPNLRLRGIMGLPAPSSDFAAQRAKLKALHDVYANIKKHGIYLDTLSMGMSADMEAAVAEGTTLLRIGTAIFGQRRM